MSELDLSVEMRAANGAVTRWGSEDTNPENVPVGISFATRLMHGFADAGLTLSRRIDADYVDLSLLDEITLVGGDGTVAYEGRVGHLPRSFDDQHTVSVQAAGWMSHAQDAKFTEVYVDRDVGAWGPMSRARRATILAVPAVAGEPSAAPDVSTGSTGLILSVASPDSRNVVEALYDAGPGRKAAVVYWTVARTNIGGAPWSFAFYNGDTDTAYNNQSASLAGAGSASGTYTPAAAARFVHIYLDSSTVVDTLAHEAHFTNVAVYGNHGLPRLGSSPYGVASSDVIKDLVGRFCPKLNSRGVQATTYPIPHLVFKDRTSPYDAFLDVNKYHLWNLACWERRTVHYAPLDYTDYDWEIRTDTEGTIVGLQGDSIEQLASGIAVQYTNVATSETDILLPADYAELRDDSVGNPFNQQGYARTTDYAISFPTTKDAALQIGRAALAEYNAPKAPGTITKSHMIRDRAGHMQPVWKVRAGDRVAITSSASLSDRPRMIHETQYDHGSRSLTMSIEGPAPRLEAINDRVLTALAAANLST